MLTSRGRKKSPKQPRVFIRVSVRFTTPKSDLTTLIANSHLQTSSHKHSLCFTISTGVNLSMFFVWVTPSHQLLSMTPATYAWPTGHYTCCHCLSGVTHVLNAWMTHTLFLLLANRSICHVPPEPISHRRASLKNITMTLSWGLLIVSHCPWKI